MNSRDFVMEGVDMNITSVRPLLTRSAIKPALIMLAFLAVLAGVGAPAEAQSGSAQRPCPAS